MNTADLDKFIAEEIRGVKYVQPADAMERLLALLILEVRGLRADTQAKKPGRPKRNDAIRTRTTSD